MEHINRLKQELQEVEGRLVKAIGFRESPLFLTILDTDQQHLLTEQMSIMQRYVDILEMRIDYDTKKAK